MIPSICYRYLFPFAVLHCHSCRMALHTFLFSFRHQFNCPKANLFCLISAKNFSFHIANITDFFFVAILNSEIHFFSLRLNSVHRNQTHRFNLRALQLCALIKLKKTKQFFSVYSSQILPPFYPFAIEFAAHTYFLTQFKIIFGLHRFYFAHIFHSHRFYGLDLHLLLCLWCSLSLRFLCVFFLSYLLFIHLRVVFVFLLHNSQSEKTIRFVCEQMWQPNSIRIGIIKHYKSKFRCNHSFGINI